jgi:hypothetical protein
MNCVSVGLGARGRLLAVRMRGEFIPLCRNILQLGAVNLI